MNTFSNTLRQHLHFLIMPLLIIVMTWPMANIIFDVETVRWPAGPGDTYMKYWDAWYGKLVLAGQADLYHTDLLFYPNGLSLALSQLQSSLYAGIRWLPIYHTDC